jgi:nucleoside-diphosphate kinase
MKEKTLSIIKPNGIKKNIVGKIIDRFESQGLKIAAAKLTQLSKEKAEGFYAEHKERPFFGELVSFMTSGPVLIMVLSGDGAIDKNRKIMGATDPKKADAGTIRKDFGDSVGENTVHGSDSPASAAREIAYFFESTEIVNS